MVQQGILRVTARGNSFADTTADEVQSKSTTITNNPSLFDMNLTFKNGVTYVFCPKIPTGSWKIWTENIK